jgi:hypothetical protein
MIEMTSEITDLDTDDLLAARAVALLRATDAAWDAATRTPEQREHVRELLIEAKQRVEHDFGIRELELQTQRSLSFSGLIHRAEYEEFNRDYLVWRKKASSFKYHLERKLRMLGMHADDRKRLGQEIARISERNSVLFAALMKLTAAVVRHEDDDDDDMTDQELYDVLDTVIVPAGGSTTEMLTLREILAARRAAGKPV